MNRGIRNNNPLNIRRTKTVWQGMRAETKDKAFVEFVNMSYGYRAAWRILFTYFYKHFRVNPRCTVSDIIHRWAPPEENDTQAYINTVLRLTGIGGKENLLPPRNPRGAWKLASILAAMTVVECGIRPEEVDTEAIRRGYELAFEVPFPKPEEDEDYCHSEERSDEESRVHKAGVPEILPPFGRLNDTNKKASPIVWDEYWD